MQRSASGVAWQVRLGDGRKGPEAGPRRASLLFAPRDVKGADRFLEPRQVLVFRLAAAECFVDV